MSDLIQNVKTSFEQVLGYAPSHIIQAPGRVNLIGEHTDYNQGFVLPAAIDFHTIIALSPRDDMQFEAIASAFEGQSNRWQFGQEGAYESALGWVNYLKAVTFVLAKRDLSVTGFNLCVAGNVPLGAGLSSSASLQVAFVTALNELCQLNLSPLEVAQVAQQAENEFIGCACGIMDQLISAKGEQNHALLIDCNDFTTTSVSMPKALDIVIVHSNVSRGLVDSKYNERREQCEQVARFFNVASLREVSLTALNEQHANINAQLGETCFKRAKHVLTENERTLQASDALQQNDIKTLSKLMAQSHLSMRDDFEITVPAIDTLVEIMSHVIQHQGGVRMTGGGFGGCVVAIVEKHLTESVIAAVNQDYPKLTGLKPLVYSCNAQQGAHRL